MRWLIRSHPKPGPRSAVSPYWLATRVGAIVAAYCVLALAADVFVRTRLTCLRADGSARCHDIALPNGTTRWSADAAELTGTRVVRVPNPAGWMIYIETRQSSDAHARAPSPYYITGFGTREQAELAATQLRAFFDGTARQDLVIEPPGSRPAWKRPLLGGLAAAALGCVVVAVIHRRRMLAWRAE